MKKLFSLLLVVVMFASMALVGSAATATNYVTVEVVETTDGITCTYYITNPNNCAGFTASLVFPTGLTTDKSFTLGEKFAVATNKASSKTGQVKHVAAISSAADYVTATGTFEMISFPLTRTDAEATFESSDFAYGTGLYVAKVAEGTTQLDNVKTPDYYADIVYIDDRAPIVTNPFSATAAGTTITCAGKVDATVENYGVEFTKESTVEGARAQKYYGAMPGDTVKDYEGSTTFTFGDWDGTFEIVLEGVHAGEKTLSFFANDTIIEGDTTFTLTIAE